MKAIKTLAITIILLLALALSLPVLIPLERYIPRLASVAAEKLGEPVAIGRLGLRLLPLPVVTLEDIRIGPQEDVRVGTVRVYPDLWSLAAPVKVLRRVEADGVTLDAPLAERLMRWSRETAGPKTVFVREVELHNVRLVFGDFQWGPLRADLGLDLQGLRRVDAGTEDGSLRVNLVPEGEQYALTLTAYNWTLPVRPALRFDQLRGQGKLDATQLVLPELEGRLYGGTLRAASRIGWEDGIRSEGEARTAGVEIEPIARLLGQVAAVSGQLYAAGRYRLGAKEAAQLAESLRATFHFEVKKGVLYNFDLAGAVRSLAREGTRGGQTSFTELSGTVHLVGKAIELRDIKVASGLLAADGNVDIAANRNLSGRLYVKMKGTAGLVSVPLELAGTLREPVLFPNRAALAGAVVGTGLMGPGLGTTVGAKAGAALDRLFR
ncbi:AsmA family protein [Thiobacter aerophilum]|uniref:AsmA family protein n=1 Tax=Thiobacter aerophilum TaxID=3121275 RepID=A0ABV0EE48_9BURK